MSAEPESATPIDPSLALEKSAERGGTKAALVIGWFSMGMAVALLGILAGAELRSRYKFNHRTPYDFYASAGEQQASEFGVGV